MCVANLMINTIRHFSKLLNLLPSLPMRTILSLLLVSLSLGFSGCYSFTGATIEGKTIDILPIKNRALNVVPTLAPTISEKLRARILSQTGLAPIDDLNADYVLETEIASYTSTIAGIANTQSVAQNRLTITLNVVFKNKLNPKADFKSTFSRFADYNASQQLQLIETQLINDIGTNLADDIFNRAFVNW